mmetsp:Transcript_12281/g.23113  ORF Transcript_12281/g.23113 Transcript_12281/m.23113 type:complete len:383 (+) Transcript_12281:98-1246(+)
MADELDIKIFKVDDKIDETEEDENTDELTICPISPFKPPLRASSTLNLESQDGALKDANQVLVRDLGQVDLSSTLTKADALFTSIMDPRNEETRKLIEDLFYEPMKAIIDKAVQAVQAIDVSDPGFAKDQIVLVGEIFDASAQVRQTCLDHVYDNMDRQIDHFSSSVDAYNLKMKETVVQVLEMYEQRIDTEIEVRSKVLKQKREEAAVMLEVSMQEAEVDAANMRMRNQAAVDVSESQLALQRKKDERNHEKELKALERAEKKAQQELERQQKKDEQEHKKAEAEIERMKKRDQAAHEKVLKELETKQKKNNIDREERNGLLKELDVELARYNKEFDLAQVAMKDALAKGRGCRITHTAPKIDWSTPPRVVPGFVSWEARR